VKSYAEHFKSYRRDVSEKARQYASGLMQAGSRKNIYAISEVVPDTDDRNLQQFITHSKWSAREVLDHVARDADELIGDATDAALIIDESGFAKQGKMSVGASRQYLGRLGKVDNGQVAVFGVLAKDVLPLPSIRGSTYPKNGPTMWSDATKRASRKANGSLRPRTNWLWKSLSRPVAMECDLAGLGPMRAMAVVRTFYFLWLTQATPS